MYELLYTSMGIANLSETDLDDILTCARTHNSANDITGLLLYSGCEFVQLLEGPQADVKSLFSDISNDTRHQSVTLVYESEIPERAFFNWSMAFAELSPPQTQTLRDSVQLLNPVSKPTGLNRNSENVGKQLLLFYQQEILLKLQN